MGATTTSGCSTAASPRAIAFPMTTSSSRWTIPICCTGVLVAHRHRMLCPSPATRSGFPSRPRATWAPRSPSPVGPTSSCSSTWTASLAPSSCRRISRRPSTARRATTSCAAKVAAERGIEIAWLGAARAYHQHHAVESPPVRHLEDILRNGAIYAERWGEWPMEGWFEGFECLGLVERDGRGWRATSKEVDAPANHRFIGGDDGNRTRVISLED